VVQTCEFELSREVFDDLFFGEMVPRWAVSVAETYEQVIGFWSENSSHALDEFGSIFDFNVVKAAHIEYEVECSVPEWQCDEACEYKLDFDICLTCFMFG
jgi:hypothetical protein